MLFYPVVINAHTLLTQVCSQACLNQGQSLEMISKRLILLMLWIKMQLIKLFNPLSRQQVHSVEDKVIDRQCEITAACLCRYLMQGDRPSFEQ